MIGREAASPGESEFPRLRRHAAGLVTTQRREAAVGERDIKPLHPLAVVEEPGGDPLRNLGRDHPIDRREVADAAALLQGPSDDGVEGLEYRFDRVDAAVRRGHLLSLPRRSRSSSAGLSAPQYRRTRLRSAAETSPSGHQVTRGEPTERGGGTHPRRVRPLRRIGRSGRIGGSPTCARCAVLRAA